MQQFYIAREGEAYGPLSVEETNRLALEGTLDRSTLVWDGNRNDWIDASAHPVIARIFERHMSNVEDADSDLITRRMTADFSVAASSEEQERLRGEIHRLESEKDELAAMVIASQERKTELEEAIRRASEANEDQERRRLGEEARSRELAEEITAAEERLAARRAELAEIEKESTHRRLDAEERSRALTEEMTAAEERLAARRAELAGIEKESTHRRRDAEERSRALTEELAAAAEQLASRRADLAGIEEESARRRRDAEERSRALTEEIAAAEERLASRRAELGGLEEELASRQTELDRLTADHGQIEAKLLATREEMSRLDRMIAEARAVREESEKSLKRLRADAAVAATAAEEVQRELKGLTRDRDRMREETTGLEIRRSAYDAEIALVNERLAAIREETAALEEKRLEAEALLGREVATAFDEIRGAIGELGRLTSAWSEFKSADEEHRRAGLRAIDEMAQRVRDREEELGRLFASVGDRARIDGERALAETTRDEANTRVGEIKEELKSLTVLCWEELRSLEASREERARLGDEIESQREESATMAARQEELIGEVSDLVGRRASLELECNGLDEALRTLGREREAHEAELADLRAMRDRLLGMNRALEDEVAATKAELARRRDELASAESTVAATAAVIEERRREIASAEDRLAAIRQEARLETAASDQRLVAVRALARQEETEAAERLAGLREQARLAAEEQDRLGQMAVEARREVEGEIEGAIRTLADLRVRHDSTAEALAAMETRRGAMGAEILRLEDESRRIEARRTVAEAGLQEAETRLADVDSRLADREKMLGRLREEEGERSNRLDRLAAEIERIETERALRAEELLQLNERTALLEAEMTALEKERATRGMADLKDLRDLLRARELREREHLEKLLGEARSEFKQLQEDWVNEERGGNTNEELRRIRSEVEEKRRELAKAERQLAAMRAGLSKLREENGRSLLRRAQSFEVQQLEELRRRIAESKNETEALEQAWSGEMKSSELVDRQWFEIRSAIEK